MEPLIVARQQQGIGGDSNELILEETKVQPRASQLFPRGNEPVENAAEGLEKVEVEFQEDLPVGRELKEDGVGRVLDVATRVAFVADDEIEGFSRMFDVTPIDTLGL